MMPIKYSHSNIVFEQQQQHRHGYQHPCVVLISYIEYRIHAYTRMNICLYGAQNINTQFGAFVFCQTSFLSFFVSLSLSPTHTFTHFFLMVAHIILHRIPLYLFIMTMVRYAQPANKQNIKQTAIYVNDFPTIWKCARSVPRSLMCRPSVPARTVLRPFSLM